MKAGILFSVYTQHLSTVATHCSTVYFLFLCRAHQKRQMFPSTPIKGAFFSILEFGIVKCRVQLSQYTRQDKREEREKEIDCPGTKQLQKRQQDFEDTWQENQ